MQACILYVLADAGREMTGSQICAAVEAIRREFLWRPHVLNLGVLRSEISAMPQYVVRPWNGIYHIRPAALDVRIDTPRIIAIRGRDLRDPRFYSFTRVDPELEKEAA